MKKVFICFIFCLGIFFTYAETKEELQKKLDTTASAIKAIEAEIADYTNKIKQTKGETTSLKKALQDLDDQKKVLEKQVTKTILSLQRTTTDITITESSIHEKEKKINVAKTGVKDLLLKKEESGDNSSLFLTLLSQKTMGDTFHYAEQSRTLSMKLRENKDALTLEKRKLEEERDNLSQKKESLSELKKELTSQKNEVAGAQQEKATLLTVTKNKESSYQELVKDRQQKKSTLEQEMNDFETKLKAIVDVTKLPKGTGALSYPVEKVIITQYFGNTPFATMNAQVYNGRGHNGIDFGLPRGSTILAAQAGTVLGTGNTDAACPGASYGKWVLIKHTNGLTSLYAHLSSFLVKAGDVVEKGQKIALSGNTGYSTGPHLHFTVYASDAVHITGPTEYKSKACGTYMIMPVSPQSGYLNPMSYF